MLACAAAAAVFFASREARPASSLPQSSAPPDSSAASGGRYSVTVRAELTSVTENGAKIQTAVPVFSGFPAAESLSGSIAETVASHVSALKALASSAPSGANIPYYCCDYFDYSLHGSILSVWITGGSYAGGANGAQTLVSFNMDLDSGRLLDSPYSLFREESAGKTLLQKQLEKKIRSQDGLYFSDALQILSRRQGDYPFYLDGDLLVVYFPAEEITPHSGGVPRFEFLLKELAVDAPLSAPLSGESSRGAVRVNGSDALMNHAVLSDGTGGLLLPLTDAAALLGKTVSLQNGVYSVDGFAAPAVIKNDVPYVPLDYFRDTLGELVFYDGTALHLFPKTA